MRYGAHCGQHRYDESSTHTHTHTHAKTGVQQCACYDRRMNAHCCIGPVATSQSATNAHGG